MKYHLDIKKNKLDLKHQELLQKLNVVYVGLFVGIISFVATWIFKPLYYETGAGLTIVFIIILYWMLNNTKEKIDKNLEDIDNLLK